MQVVLDSNVLSELMRATPVGSVLQWLSAQDSAGLCTTSVSVAEVRFGIARLPPGRRRTLLHEAADEVFGAFADRVLVFDGGSAAHYAELVAGREAAGAPISGFDGQIAAICRQHEASLATRNIADFRDLGLHLVDPWRGGS